MAPRPDPEPTPRPDPRPDPRSGPAARPGRRVLPLVVATVLGMLGVMQVAVGLQVGRPGPAIGGIALLGVAVAVALRGRRPS